jgi:hypothetical protein
VAGTKCDHLAFTQEGVDWEIWVQQGDTPIPRMIVLTYKNTTGEPRYTMMITRWDNSPIKESVFSVEPPAGASKIDLLPVQQQQAPPATEPAPTPAPAPSP